MRASAAEEEGVGCGWPGVGGAAYAGPPALRK